MSLGPRSRVVAAAKSVGGFLVAAECRPAEEVGGDFHVVVSPGAGRLSVVIGDACGRGRSGAALLPEIMPKVRELADQGARPGDLLARLNQKALVTLPLDRFVTAAAIEIDAALSTLTIANAGHVPALLKSPSANVRIVGKASGPPLGVVANATYLEECVPLDLGELILLMTDGVLEAVESDLLSMTTLRRLLGRAPAGALGTNRFILSTLDQEPAQRSGDDVTLLCLEVTPAAAGAALGLKRAS